MKFSLATLAAGVPLALAAAAPQPQANGIRALFGRMPGEGNGLPVTTRTKCTKVRVKPSLSLSFSLLILSINRTVLGGKSGTKTNKHVNRGPSAPSPSP